MKKLILGLMLMLFAVPAFAADLQRQIDILAREHKGKLAFIAKDLQTGATVGVAPDRPVATASVIKVAVMVEAFYQIKAGKHRLDERLTLTKQNQVEGSGVLTLLQPGLQPSLQDAITLMITQSDNTATNMVIDAIGIPAVNARIAEMGLKNTYLYKKVFMPADGPVPADQKQFGLGKTTPREMATILESIERCDLGDRKLCGQMIGIMKNQFYRTMIPRYLETVDTTDTESAIANKTGSEDDSRNDVGIVYTKQGPIVICAFTYGNADRSWTVDNGAEVFIAKLAKAVVDAWARTPANSAPRN
jgi:beta-lactamase class A